MPRKKTTTTRVPESPVKLEEAVETEQPDKTAIEEPAEDLSADAAKPEDNYKPLDVGAGQKKMEEPIDASEKFVTVKPNCTFDTYIGQYHWYFTKDVPHSVPVGVKDILANGKKIYP